MQVLMDSVFLLIGSLLAGLGVLLSGFGAHGLRTRGSLERIATFDIGVRFQITHALAILLVSIAVVNWPDSIFPPLAGWLFVGGIVVFSGSLYMLVITGKRPFSFVTPVGGLALVAGWICLALTAIL
jgi:uncharacterized membrane protein YgdD (TMEM256/DUF423 family)